MRASNNPTWFLYLYASFLLFWLWKRTKASLVFCGFSSELQQQMTPSSPTVTTVLSWMGWTPTTGAAWPILFVVAGRVKATCFLRRAASSRARDSCSMYAHRSTFITKTQISLRRRPYKPGKMYLIHFLLHEKQFCAVQLTHEILPLPKQSIFLNKPWTCGLVCKIKKRIRKKYLLNAGIFKELRQTTKMNNCHCLTILGRSKHLLSICPNSVTLIGLEHGAS